MFHTVLVKMVKMEDRFSFSTFSKSEGKKLDSLRSLLALLALTPACTSKWLKSIGSDRLK